jgi:hypothetical protein
MKAAARSYTAFKNARVLKDFIQEVCVLNRGVALVPVGGAFEVPVSHWMDCSSGPRQLFNSFMRGVDFAISQVNGGPGFGLKLPAGKTERAHSCVN